MLEKIHKIYFIGIGGVGVSATAKLLKRQGKKVLGSDVFDSEMVDSLRQEGVKIFLSQEADNISADIDLVVYSVAVPASNPERLQAKKLGLTALSYPQLLGELVNNKFGVAVAGTNGKTTTTAMLSKILIDAGVDPSVIIGGKTDYLNGNARLGDSNYFVYEADEYRRAFDNYCPQMAVITYIVADHLDYFRDEKDFISAFDDFISRVPSKGYVYINSDDDNSVALSGKCQAQVITYGIDRSADIMAKNIRHNNGEQIFDLYFQAKELGRIVLKVPGRYNIYNFLSAVGPALALGVDFSMIRNSIADFFGSWRRFQRLGRLNGAEVIVDYAHTPDAIFKVIQASKEFFPNKKIMVVFQPHQFNRTKNFFDQFVQSFTQADKVVIGDIFYVAGREDPKDFDVSGQKLYEAVKAIGADAEYGGDLNLTYNIIKDQAGHFDVILILGAGDIYEVAKKLIIKS